MAKKKEQQKITLTQFKTWIKGFEELSDSEKDWCPTLSQWKKIREKIELIDEQSIQQNNPRVVASTTQPHVETMTPPPSSGLLQPPSGLSRAPRMVSNIPVSTSPLNQPPSAAPGGLNIKGTDTVVQDGPYNTPFV